MAKKRRKNSAAVSLGRKGGHAKWAKLGVEERSAIMRKVVSARWAKRKPES